MNFFDNASYQLALFFEEFTLFLDEATSNPNNKLLIHRYEGKLPVPIMLCIYLTKYIQTEQFDYIH